MARKRKKQQKSKKKLILGISSVIFASGVYFFLPKIENIFFETCDSITHFAGFYVKNINITAADQKTKDLIKKNLGISEGENIFKLSIEEIYNNVMKIGWVKDATVSKNLPNVITIKVTEKSPIAVFQHNSKFTLVNESGDFIEDITEKPAELPVISGDEANLNIAEFLEIISKFKTVKDKINSLTYIRKRRWDIKICGGIHVKLPENDIEKSLEILTILLKQGNINKNTVKAIDLRVPESVIINGLKEKTETSEKKKTKV